MVLVSNLVALTMGGIFVVAERVEGGANRPLGLWASSFVLKALGLLLIYLRSSIPDLLSFSVANSLVVISAQLVFLGVREFLGQPGRPSRHLPAAALTFLVAQALFVGMPYGIAIGGVLSAIIAWDMAAVFAMLQPAPRGMQRAHRFVAAVLLFEVALLAFRAVSVFLAPPQATFSPSLVTTVFYLQVTMGSILLGAGLLVLLYRRSHLAEQERVTDLETALAKVRTLEGMLPICAWCKRIRDDQDHWQAMERYVASRTDASFSHSICPDCATKFEGGSTDAPRSEPTP
jgi:NADH:ubiquinone oxidoreductase subunit K